MKGKVDSVIKIPTTLDDFFRYWFEFLKPFHQLTGREIDVATALVKQRYKLSKVITDNNLLDTVLMSEETKRKIREDCNITLAHFQVIMGKLRKNKVIVDNKINPKLIPNIDKDSKSLQLMVIFPIK